MDRVRFADLGVVDRAEVQMILRDAHEFVVENPHLVVHKGDHVRGAVYIGRPTEWGNVWPLEDYPLLTPEYERRVLCLQDYTANLLFGSQQELRDKLYLLRGRPLACWCRRRHRWNSEKLCHGDVLSYLANKLGSF